MSSATANYTDRLRRLMQAAKISTYRQLCEATGVSEKVLRRLRHGEIVQMKIVTLNKIAAGLGISPGDLLNTFTSNDHTPATSLQQEYDRLQQQLIDQRATLIQEFQQASLQTIESWMLQWPTAAHAATQNPAAPAVKLLPLVRPIEHLLCQWQVEPIGQVGETVPFDPQQHQVIGPSPEPTAPCAYATSATVKAIGCYIGQK